MLINIPKDFSSTPGGRYRKGGSFSGEEFRDDILIPAYIRSLAFQERLVLLFDGGYGYPPGFLEEVFGGMVRLGFSGSEMISIMTFVSDEEPNLIPEILGDIYAAEECLLAERV